MIYRIAVPGIALNTYLIVDSKTHRAAVIDPSRSVQPILRLAKEAGATIVAILETHLHADFVSGADKLAAALDNTATIYRSGEGGALGNVKDQQIIDLGSYQLQAWHTPGHTPEHIMWVLFDDGKPTHAFTGDFLFVGSIGRPDLLGEEAVADLASQLYRSIFDILPRLPGETEILPGHGAGSLCGKGISGEISSTLAQERIKNPYLKPLPKEQWIKDVLKDLPHAPTYFARMKKINAAQDISKASEVDEGVLVVDLRSKEEFAKGHLPGSIYIGYGPSFIRWAPLVLPYDRSLMLVANDKRTIEAATEALHLVGMDAPIYGKLWNNVEESFDKLGIVKPFVEDRFPGNALLLDVRTKSEVEEDPIEEALAIPLSELPSRLKEVPKDKPIVVMCHSGYRAAIAASLLQNRGYSRVSAIFGLREK